MKLLKIKALAGVGTSVVLLSALSMFSSCSKNNDNVTPTSPTTAATTAAKPTPEFTSTSLATTYTSSGAITAKSNTTYSCLVINLNGASTNGFTLQNLTNVHITNCKIINTKGFAINIYNCSNVTIDNCLISNVGFGVYAQGNSKNIKVNNNQFLNINGISTASLGHAVQYNGVNGGGNQVNNNRIENIAGVALHPHDMINLYQCNGLQGDSIQVIGNWIRGGQLTLWPNSYSGAAGIIMGDVAGSYQVCRNNILVNPGYAGIQCIGTGYGIKIDHNKIFSVQTTINSNAICVLDAKQIEVSYNKTNWTNRYGHNAVLPDGEPQYYLGNPASPTPKNFNTNSWATTSISTSVLPTTIITLN